MPMKEICGNCNTDTRNISKRVTSMKYGAYFCNQECYEGYVKMVKVFGLQEGERKQEGDSK